MRCIFILCYIICIICDVYVYVDVECMLDVVNIDTARKISDSSDNYV